MGVIGSAFTPTLPSVDDDGPGWAEDLNEVLTELITRASTQIDSTSIALTTGDVKHGTRPIHLGPAATKASSGITWTPASGGSSAYHLSTGASDLVEWDLPLDRGQRLTAVRVTGRANGATAWSCRVWLHTTSAGTRTAISSTTSSAITAAIEEKTASGLTVTTLADGQYISVEWTSGASGNRALAMEFDVDRTAT